MKNKQNGMALITVLLSLSLMMVIATSITIAGNITYRVGLLNTLSLRNNYIAESQMTHSIWDMVHELKYHTNRKLGYQSELIEEDEEIDDIRYYADGEAHIKETDNKIITVIYDDAHKGFDFGGNINSSKINIIKAMVKLPFDADPTPVDDFIDKLIDYTDRNDLFQAEGAEREQYTELSGFDLPRNSPLEFAEEALWIPGIEDALFSARDYMLQNTEGLSFNISDYLRVIPYRGVSYPKSNKPNFFSSTNYQLMLYADLEDDELEEVLLAKKRWYDEKISLQESIPDLYGKLSRYFSFNESKVYRIRVQVSQIDSGVAVNKEVVLKLDRNLPRYRPDTFSGLRYWRQVNF